MHYYLLILTVLTLFNGNIHKYASLYTMEPEIPEFVKLKFMNQINLCYL